MKIDSDKRLSIYESAVEMALIHPVSNTEKSSLSGLNEPQTVE